MSKQVYTTFFDAERMEQLKKWLADDLFFQSMVDGGEDNSSNQRVSAEQENHREREILLIFEGETEFILDGKVFPATPGTVFFLDHWVSHQRSYAKGAPDFVHMWFHFHKDRLSGNIMQMKNNSLFWGSTWSFPEEVGVFLEYRWDRLVSSALTLKERRAMYRSMLRTLREELIHMLQSPDKPLTGNPVLERVESYIKMNYGRNCSFSELEVIAGRNKSYIMRGFRKKHGVTVGEYINQVRRGFAAVAESQGMTQKEIADQLGFGSASAYWLWKKRDKARSKQHFPPYKE